jgi:sigma-B regulation protein RsbU (phosphoserine phosphatase)
MLFAVWDDDSRVLTVANSGAVQPIMCREGEASVVNAEGFPLGLFPNVTYDEIPVAAQPGDVFVFISDGIPDAENPFEEMFGTERLEELIRAQRHESATEIAETILAEVTRFQSGHDRFDDETIIVLKVT